MYLFLDIYLLYKHLFMWLFSVQNDYQLLAQN